MRSLAPSPVSGLAAVAAALAAAAGCQPRASAPIGPVAFDTAAAWVVQGADSFPLLVEIARSETQQSVGLSGRPSLDPGSGMVFEFDRVRTGDDGFWMYDTRVPLEIAFIDEAGVVRRILAMEPCPAAVGEDDCPGYFPGVPYTAALEVNRGWFSRRGVREGARVTWARRVNPR